MTNYSYALFSLTFFFLIILFSGCSDDISEKVKYRKNSSCIAPQEIGIDDYVTTASKMDGIKYKWDKVEGAIGYKIYWRDTTSPTWDHSRFVGDVSAYTLDGIVIDNYFFGIAAVGPNGHESVVVFPNSIFR